MLRQAVQGISDLVMLPGLINLDFADVRTTMLEAGDAVLGIGMGYGEHRATLAAEKAVSSPLLETSVEGAHSLLLSITGGPDLSLIEASEAAEVVRAAAHPEAEIIFGASVDDDMSEEVWITVIATRFDSAFANRHRRDRRTEPREPRTPDRDAALRPERYSDPVGDWRSGPRRHSADELYGDGIGDAAVSTGSRRSRARSTAASSTCPSSSPSSSTPATAGTAANHGFAPGLRAAYAPGMASQRGVVAAGHPLTAEAGAQVLREGGGAVDAAICAVLTSFVCESQLTGFGAGGFMMVHESGRDTLVDFFVAAGGADGIERRAELVPIPVYFDETPQTFNCGAASCGVPGNPAGLEHVHERFGTVPLSRLAEPGIKLGREGVTLSAAAEYFHEILRPIYESTPESRALYEPEGRQLVEGDVFRFPEMSDALERFAAEGRRRSTPARRRGRSATGCASAAGPWGWTTWPPTSRSSASPSAPASAATRC